MRKRDGELSSSESLYLSYLNSRKCKGNSSEAAAYMPAIIAIVLTYETPHKEFSLGSSPFDPIAFGFLKQLAHEDLRGAVHFLVVKPYLIVDWAGA